MSSSASPLPLMKLIADARFPTATVSIMDGRYGMVAEGVGRVEVSLPPGLYLVQFKAGQMYEQQRVDLSKDQTVFAERLVPDSPPASSTRRMIPDVPDASEKRSQLYVSVEGDAADQFLQRLEVLDSSKNIVTDFSASSPLTTTERIIALLPGTYLLRFRTDEGAPPLEQTVVACDAWQLQIFYRAPSRSKREIDWAQVLASAPILMVPLEFPLAGLNRDREWIEVALENLAGRRAMAPVAELRDAVNTASQIQAYMPDPNTLRQMLKEKFTDPMLGVLGAHLLLLAPDPDRALVEAVVKNLDILLPGHPDVTALKLWLGQLSPADLSFPMPPMLRSSWSIIVNKTAQTPGLVPAGSYASRAAERVSGAGGWLVWRSPAAVHSEVATIEPIGDLLNTVRKRLEALSASKSPSELRTFFVNSGLSDAEISILQYVANVVHSEATSRELVASLYKSGFLGTVWTLTQKLLPGVSLVSKDRILEAANKLVSGRLSTEKIIQSLELPESALAAALSNLTQKLPSA